MQKKIRNTLWILILFYTGFCSLSLASVLPKNHSHCNNNKYLYCSDKNNDTPVNPVRTYAFRYRPVFDFAQYMLHEGDARSANLIEGFFPLYQQPLNTLSFADIRLYNPNGRPIEINLDVGLRQLYHQNKRLFGLYAGYDRYRSNTKNYYNQANAGIDSHG